MRRVLAAFFCVLMLTACFDYRGLEEQVLIAGIAVDSEGGSYRLTFEIVDIGNAENGQFGSMILVTTGETLADALEAAGEKLHREVYLGTLRVVLLSRGIAEEAGLGPFVMHLLDDLRVRNSLPLAIAGGETAGELLTPGGGRERRVIVSNVLGERLGGRRHTPPVPALYEIYNDLHTDGGEIALPIVTVSEAEGILFEISGLARFQGGRLEKGA